MGSAKIALHESVSPTVSAIVEVRLLFIVVRLKYARTGVARLWPRCRSAATDSFSASAKAHSYSGSPV